MPLMEIQFSPGVIADLTDYSAKPAWIDASGYRWDLGKPRLIGGEREIRREPAFSVLQHVRKAIRWQTSNGNTRYAIGNPNELWLSDSDDIGTYTNITPAGLTNVGNDESQITEGYGRGNYGDGNYGEALNITTTIQNVTLWNLLTFGDDLIAFPRDGEILYYDLSAAGATAVEMATLTGASHVPARASTGLLFGPQRILLLGGTYEFEAGNRSTDDASFNPLLLRWSDQNNPLLWDSSDDTQASGEIAIGSDLSTEIVGMIETRGELLISTDTEIYSAVYGGFDAGFAPEFESDRGAWISPNCCVDVNGRLFWMGKNGFFTYNGTVERLDCPVEHSVFAEMNPLGGEKVFARHNEEWGEVWWAYSAVDNMTDPTKFVIYNYQDNIWYFLDYRDGIITAWIEGTNYGWKGNKLWEHELPGEQLRADTPVFLQSSPIELGDGNAKMHLNRIVPDVEGTGTIRITPQDWPEDDPEDVNAQEFNLPTDKVDMGMRTRMIRIRYEVRTPGARIGATRYRAQLDGDE